MKLNILKANRWKFPEVSFHKYDRKKVGKNCFTKWFHFERYWSGKLWYFTVRNYQMTWDFRMCPWSDMVFPSATKQDRDAVKEANKYL